MGTFFWCWVYCKNLVVHVHKTEDMFSYVHCMYVFCALCLKIPDLSVTCFPLTLSSEVFVIVTCYRIQWHEITRSAHGQFLLIMLAAMRMTWGIPRHRLQNMLQCCKIINGMVWFYSAAAAVCDWLRGLRLWKPYARECMKSVCKRVREK